MGTDDTDEVCMSFDNRSGILYQRGWTLKLKKLYEGSDYDREQEKQ